MRENGKGTYRDDGDKTYSVCKRTKQGNQRFPGKPRKLHYKRKGWVVKKAARKKERNTRKKKFSRKNYQKNLCRKKNTKGKTNTASRYPAKATIAHTRIQRESNFASFEG